MTRLKAAFRRLCHALQAPTVANLRDQVEYLRAENSDLRIDLHDALELNNLHGAQLYELRRQLAAERAKSTYGAAGAYRTPSLNPNPNLAHNKQEPTP